MRFSETLRFNANPAWWEFYIPYDTLKARLTTLRHLYNAHHGADFEPPQHLYITDSEDDDDHNPAPDPQDDGAASADTLEAALPPRKARQKTQPPLHRIASARALAEISSSDRSAPHLAALSSAPAFASRQNSGLDAAPPPPVPASASEAGLQLQAEDRAFFAELRRSAHLVDDFYSRLAEALSAVVTDVVARSAKFVEWRRAAADTVEDTPLLQRDAELGDSFSPSDDELSALRDTLVAHYTELEEAVSFAKLNYAAFDKLLRRHDDAVHANARHDFLAELASSKTFPNTRRLDLLIAELERVYGDVFTDGDAQAAQAALREGLRQLVVVDRDTMWRDALRKERRTNSFHPTHRGAMLQPGNEAGGVRLQARRGPVLVALVAFVLLMLFPGSVERILVTGDGADTYSAGTLAAANRCLAVVAAVVVLWAVEGIPLYVTSFLVLLCSVLCGVFVDADGTALDAHAASKEVFAHLASPTLLLIVCVYSFGAALSKFEIDKLLATRLLARASRPHLLLASVMYLAVGASMLVSNVAAPVLLNSVLAPTLSALRDSGGRSLAQCLLLGIMVSSNVGGFASPIASPQSAVALGLLTGENRISFFKWLFVALPVCLFMVTVFFFALSAMFKPSEYALPPVPRATGRLGVWHWTILGTLGATIVLWAVHPLAERFGSAGMVAAVPIVVLFGTGVLEKEDFNNLPWDVVWLVAGGSVLGAAVASCKLLDIVAARLVTLGGDNLFGTYAVLVAALALLANAVSHTVSAIIFLPLFFKIGLELGHPQLLVVGGACAASCAMALPVSSFPNISASQVQDERGECLVTNDVLLRVGSLMTVIAAGVLLTVGYVLMIEAGF